MNKRCSVSVIHRATDQFSAQSIFHSPSYMKFHSTFRPFKQNKRELVSNNWLFDTFSTKKSSQVVVVLFNLYLSMLVLLFRT